MIGTEEDGFTTLPTTQYEELEYELEKNQVAVAKLQWEIIQLVQKNFLEEEVNEEHATCVCDVCLDKFQAAADPTTVKDIDKWLM